MASSTARLQRRVWDRRAGWWDHDAAPGLEKVVDAVIRTADPQPGTTALDLGCGTGHVALVLARAGVEVTAVDVSPEMIDRLRAKVSSEQLPGVVGVVAAIEEFDLESESVDLVVSNYALHHLRDRDKREVVRAAVNWLRPGGRIVLGDMMFGRGLSTHDRSIVASKVAALARRGPAGWWRVMKNAARFSFRLQERPVPMARWKQYFEDAGLTGVMAFPVVAEAAVVVGTKP